MKQKYIIGIDEVGRAASKRRASPNSYIIGIDEVGRGPLAGPVTVAAIAATANFKFLISNFQKKFKVKLRDSKKLSPKQREIWFKWIKKQKIPLAIADISPKIIDKINISKAANLAATRCIIKLTTNNQRLTIKNCKIFLDGGLYLNLQPTTNNQRQNKIKAKTIIRGDEKIPVISLASIVAKVHRDKLMEKLSKKYPLYGFEKHKGYGTKLHYKNIKKHGISEIHRKSFLKKLQ
ncbi:MAG: ribonuclease HII [Patescibacteria group bacterium]